MNELKNLSYLNFERNRYFYGKLLSVDDFETEQRYMNDKRRLINRLVHGTGVVCGMEVIQADDESVSVEMGLALDFAGREIVIQEPVTKKLSMLDGFSDYQEDDEANQNMYLCIAYDEKEKEAVHSIAARQQAGRSEEYNKYAESYRLYLTSREPEESTLVTGLYQSSRILYQGDGIVIRQTVPKYVETEKEFEILVELEKGAQDKPVDFSLSYYLNGIEPAGQEKAEIIFREREFDKADYYAIRKKFRAKAVKEMKGFLETEPDSFRLQIGERDVRAQVKEKCSVRIVSNDIRREISASYYRSAMENMMKNAFEQGIYLARLAVVRAGDTYLIDSLEPMPFGQYVFSNTLADAMERLELLEHEKNELPGRSVSSSQTPAEREQPHYQIVSGEAVLDLGLGGVKGQKFFSEEIVHGLGIGPVTVALGLADGLGDSSCVVFGDGGVFAGENGSFSAKLAAKADPEKGSFVIGMECLEHTSERQVRICWTVLKDAKAARTAEDLEGLYIKPDMLNLGVRESYYFEAVLKGESESRITWGVKGKHGGTIDENGMYTAPGEPGIYEVTAQSMDYPELKASTFVMVRNKG